MKYILFLLLLLQSGLTAGQSWTTRTYTITDGLPGNTLYSIIRDHNGFLWIGSDNGLVRFDGNNFRQYRVTEGLPDNEIIQVLMDKDNVIWALPYRKLPAYYNPLTDRFETRETQPWLNELPTGPENRLDVLEGGGISISGSNGKAGIVRKGRVDRVFNLPAHNRNASPAQITIALAPDKYLLVSADSLRIFDHNRFSGGSPSLLPYNSRTLYINKALYSTDTISIYKSVLNSAGEVSRLQSCPLPFSASHLSFTGRHLVLISDNGTTATLIDTSTLQAVEYLPLNGALASDILEDDEGHIWVATTGQGLIKLSHLPVSSYNHLLPIDMAPGTVAVSDSTFLCGDNKGRIAVFRRGCIEKIINISKWSKAVSRIRNILVLRDGYYVAVEGDASLLLDKQFNIISVYNRPILNYTDRCATLWHDSIILAGSHARAVRLNYRACLGYDTVPIRTTAINADSRGRLLIGSSDGCYRKDDTGLYDFGKAYKHFATRVSDICVTPDGLVWVGLASNYVVAIKGDDIIGLINLGTQIPGNICNTLSAGGPGQLWIGTDKSLSRVAYTVSGNRLSWHATSFGAMDGIPGQINDIALRHDSVYIASTSGLYTMPAATQPVVKEIPVFITGIRINDNDTSLKLDWELPYDMNDMDIQYSGVDLSGYSPSYQYRINNEDWQNAGGDHLALKRLSPGTYRIDIRALKRDGSPSVHIASLRLHLQTPFWLSIWFWLTIFFILLILSALTLQNIFRRKREKQLRQVAAEHELVTSQQQTFSALMNPHFIFNALNSIQHYVLVHDKKATNRYLSGFGRLIRMNFESAQKSYISLEEELERLQLYLSLEKMRFGEKLSYSIEVAKDVATEDWQIPAMIIQPYLENALLHGIAPAKNDGKLDITISRKQDKLVVCITDNGIGIANSRQLKRQEDHISRSMDLIRRRIAILKKLHKQSITIEISPASEADATHPGTKVVMTFPEHFVD